MNSLVVLASICFVAMLSPGPDFILVSRNAIRYPRAQALATAFGIVSGCLVHATYCTLGLAIVITHSVMLFNTVRYAGAVYLLYLGVKGLISKGSVGVSSTEATFGSPPSLRIAFTQGFLCNLLNPKLAVFLLTLFSQFIDVNASMLEKGQVSLVFVTESALYWPTLVLALQMSQVRCWLSSWAMTIDRVCGAMLIGLGIRVALPDR